MTAVTTIPAAKATTMIITGADIQCGTPTLDSVKKGISNLVHQYLDSSVLIGINKSICMLLLINLSNGF